MQHPSDSTEPYPIPSNATTELSDAEREQLKQILQTRSLDAKHLAYCLADAKSLPNLKTHATQCVVAQLPNKAKSAPGDVSVCGAKKVLIEELRQFTMPNGNREIRCASVAVLEMTDSPVHVHASTLEHYIVLSGQGKLILGAGADEQVVDVQQGSVVLIPPGQPHGIVSNDSKVPIRALLTFTPGLASKDEPEFRDEKVVYTRASDRAARNSWEVWKLNSVHRS